ncbi:ComEC/Rec2 family competence protein [uncultured Oscillibacter sp.]|uniref:ComEC/Rec2 family competence protein n=2 Tax=uncultured Oscillibacter sp. TaxID=876091 RepID=UPI0026397B8D|nr:MBL fold metallo-hydrolase [uncultured Oscillibacter sp.]
MEKMKLTFVNVGYGEAILLECPDPARPGGAFVMVIDGGSGEDGEYRDRASGRVPLAEYLSAGKLDHIDVMVCTHVHEDHLCGLVPLPGRWPPGEFWQTLPESLHRSLGPLPPLPEASASQRKFLQSIADYRTLCAGVEAGGGVIRTISAGWEAGPCPGLTVRCLGPSRARAAELAALYEDLHREKDPGVFRRKLSSLDGAMNNYSAVLLLEYRGTRILLPGDTNRLGYGEIDPADLRAHIFKVGHHGQRDGADAALIQAVRPRAAVCCASSDRRYQSAHPELLRLLSDSGADLWFSDCPSGLDLPPHRALEFTVGAEGAFTAEYDRQEGADV